MNTGATAHETGRQPSGTTAAAEKISNTTNTYYLRTRRRPMTISSLLSRCTTRRRNGLRRRYAKGCDECGGRIYLLILFFSRTRGKDKKKVKMNNLVC